MLLYTNFNGRASVRIRSVFSNVNISPLGQRNFGRIKVLVRLWNKIAFINVKVNLCFLKTMPWRFNWTLREVNTISGLLTVEFQTMSHMFNLLLHSSINRTNVKVILSGQSSIVVFCWYWTFINSIGRSLKSFAFLST